MFQSSILEVAIGMIFLFLLLSLLATAVQEALAGRMNLRGNLLQAALRNMVGPGLTKEILEHPLVQGSAKSKRLPSYIAKENFTQILANELRGFTGLPQDLNTFEQRMKTIANPELKRVVETLNIKTPAEFDVKVAAWFESTMDRWSGSYKRLIQRNLFWMGVSLAIVLNADAIQVFQHLATDDQARLAVVEQAIRFAEENPHSDYQQLLDSAKNLLQRELDGQNEEIKKTLGIGWYTSVLPKENSSVWMYIRWGITKIVGWLITAYAITLGAPFWFDLLKKAIQVRNAGVKPEEKKDGK